VTETERTFAVVCRVRGCDRAGIETFYIDDNPPNHEWSTPSCPVHKVEMVRPEMMKDEVHQGFGLCPCGACLAGTTWWAPKVVRHEPMEQVGGRWNSL